MMRSGLLRLTRPNEFSCNALAPRDLHRHRRVLASARALHAACFGSVVCFVENVRSGGMRRRAYYGGPQPSDATIIASRVPVLLMVSHSTACVQLSFEVIHFLVILWRATWSSWGTCAFRQRGCYRR